MTSDRTEWVEIIEPRTKEHMYANLTTGDCVWNPPEGVRIKRTNSSQWWELFDANTQRFYYYNVATQATVWHRPNNCDIIPLAKLQTSKQNIDLNEKKDNFTQTSHSKIRAQRGDDITNGHQYHFTGYGRTQSPDVSKAKCSSEAALFTSHGKCNHRVLPETSTPDKSKSSKIYRHSQASGVSREGNKHNTSGKSSDSSLSSTHDYRRLKEGGSLRISNSHKNKYQQQFPHAKLSCSVSNSSDLGTLCRTYYANIPSFKKKLSSDSSLQSKRENNESKMLETQSFDYPNEDSISLKRSGSFISSQQIQRSNEYKSNIDESAGAASDDSMHEKYFKSLENTPITSRKLKSPIKSSCKKKTNNSNKQTSINPQNQNNYKSCRPSVLINSALEHFGSSHNSDPDFSNFDLTEKPTKYLDKKKLQKRSSNTSHSIISNSNSTSGKLSDDNEHNFYVKSFSERDNMKNDDKYSPTISYKQSDQYNLSKNSSQKSKNSIKNEVKNIDKFSGIYLKNQIQPVDDVEYDNGNTSPLYSNWDLEMQEHLLPLQHYIIEQAKLRDPLDSDSFHSDSHSEHSFSGHEPDNEDSDHSDGRSCYLTHNYGLMDDCASYMADKASYYNFDKNTKEDISENLEAILERERGNTEAISPVRHLVPFHFISQTKEIAQHQNKVSTDDYKTRVNDHRSQLFEHNINNDKLLLEKRNQEEKKSFSELQKPVNEHPQLEKKKTLKLAVMKECDIEKFAQDNLNLHSKGIFRKKTSIRDMLSWTSNAISRPMLALAGDKTGKKLATELFKLVQIYMGDRKARVDMNLNSVAIDIVVTALGHEQLRDELYVQLCRQTTENPKRESLIRGWELMAICLFFVSPSQTFQPALLNYMNRHRDPTFAASFPEVGKWPIHVQISHYATVCCRRLSRISNSNKKQIRKPTEDEIEQARNQILRDSMFGNTLAEVMELQKEKYPERKLPWIQVTLSEQVLLLNGKQTEGIFRVSADIDEVNSFKVLLDRWEIPEHKNTMDAHTPASLLKLWYRELYDPLIPDELYNECVEIVDASEANKIISKLPELNKLVLTYLIHFLQKFAQPDVVSCTKMDSSNLAMVFAPNCLRCTSDDPKIILENARKEMTFIRILIQHMDTSSVENIL